MSYKLIENVEEIRDYIVSQADGSGKCMLDTEASSKNVKVARIAGISASVREGTAIYAPLGHRIGRNLDPEKVVGTLKECLKDFRLGFYNAKYDLSILEYCSPAPWTPTNYIDVIELVYLDNPDRKEKKLKTVVKEDFNVDMVEFEELFTDIERKTKQMDITTKSPGRVFEYACADSDLGLKIWNKYAYVEKEFPFPVRVDTELVQIVKEIEYHAGLELNVEYINKMYDRVGARAEALKEMIYRTVGVSFDIESPKQLGTMLFERMGYTSGGTTKKGQYKTDEDTLDLLAKQYPLVEWTIVYKKLVKARGSYLKKLKALAELGVKPRFSFHIYQAPTFRFSAPGGNIDEDGFSGVNIQAVSDGEVREMPAVPILADGSGRELIHLDDDEMLLGKENRVEIRQVSVTQEELEAQVVDLPYVVEREEGGLVCIRDICQGCPAICPSTGMDLTRRRMEGVKILPSIRESLKAPEGYTLLSGDYDKQELLIGANISGEPLWIDALNAGKDLHAVTGAAAYGQPDLDGLSKEERKRKRQIGKTINFLVFFGGNEYTMVKKLRIPLATATQIFNTIRESLVVLYSWIDQVKRFSRKNGFTTTYFGRRRWLKEFYSDPNDWKRRAFGDRSAVNTCIQGTGADVTRIAMVKIAKLFKRENITKEIARLVLQIHDELMMLVRNDVLEALAPKIKKEMEFEVKGWKAPLKVSLKQGPVWGKQKEMST